MFIGHLPAAYLFGQAVRKSFPSMQLSTSVIVSAALVGGILPDFDLIYFYTIGGKQVVHHKYWSHTPFYWLVIYLTCATFALLFQYKKVFRILSIVFSAIMLHLILDTITGTIYWLHPYSATAFTFVQVPAVHQWWVANFIMHWTFGIELLLLVIAAMLFLKRGIT